MRMQEIIAKKRDGLALTTEEIDYVVTTFTSGDLPDYQMAALLMAIYLRGMSPDETASLTAAMADSGERLDLSSVDRPTLDKHSTGGVGDKTSLVVVPMLAAAGVAVCKMSGRGLGHTGGTLDKLESIPGYRVDLTPGEMLDQVRRIGACLAGQTAEIAAADKPIYALRDATATVGSLPLIVSSILSKKLAGGASSLLFDVKVGSGALLPSEQESRELARALVRVAAAHGRKAVALLTDMSRPLGRTIGNALEVREAIATLTPDTPGINLRWHDLCVKLCAEGLKLAGLAGEAEATAAAENTLRDGSALAVFRAIVEAQGGDVRVVDDPSLLPGAPAVEPVPSRRSGYVVRIDTAALGRAVVALGGGRSRKGDAIDHAVGLEVQRSVGDRVATGEALVTVHSRTRDDVRLAADAVGNAIEIADHPPEDTPLVLGYEET